MLDCTCWSESYYRALPPDIVVYPETTAEVAEIVKLCAGADMPIVPFGAGTSLEGNASSVEGGVCIDFARMNKVLTVHDSDMNVVVQPGITRKQLTRRWLKGSPDCSSPIRSRRPIASIGGADFDARHRAPWRCATAP